MRNAMICIPHSNIGGDRKTKLAGRVANTGGNE
jgi:hypothetical protein